MLRRCLHDIMDVEIFGQSGLHKPGSISSQTINIWRHLWKIDPYVSWELIGDFMTSAFEKIGVPREEAAICLGRSDGKRQAGDRKSRLQPLQADLYRPHQCGHSETDDGI